MASAPDRLRLKDRIIANVSRAVKSVQECYGSTEENPFILGNKDRQSQRLCEHLDHVFLHGLKHIGHGYWKVVTEFTRKNAVKEIKRLKNVTTDLGRGRAWLFMALNESSLESYLRCFEMNEKLVRKHYVKESLILDQQRMNVLQTLTAGLEYAVFQLDYDVAYLDLSTYPPRTRAESEEVRQDDDKVSLCSMDSVLPSKDRSLSMLSTQRISPMPNGDGDDASVQSADTSSASHDSKTMSIDSGYHLEKNDSQDKLEEIGTRISRLESAIVVQDDCEEDLGIEVIHVKSKNKKKKSKKKIHAKHIEELHKHMEKDDNHNFEKDDRSLMEPKLIRSPGDGMDSPVSANDSLSQTVNNYETQNNAVFNKSTCVSEKTEERLHELDRFYDNSSKDDLENHEFEEEKTFSYSKKDVSKIYQLSFDGDSDEDISDTIDSHLSNSIESQSLNEMSLKEELDLSSNDCVSDSQDKTDSNNKQVSYSEISVLPQEGASAIMTESYHDEISDQHKTGSSVNSYIESKSVTSQLQDRADYLIYESDAAVNKTLYQEEDEFTVLRENEEEEEKVEVDPLCEGEIKLDNNALLNLMLEVFEDSDEQFIKIFGTRMGHTEGETKTVYVLITDKTLYFLSHDQTDQKFVKDAAVQFTDLDYVSLSVEEQVIQIVCTNRRKQFWITTGNQLVTRSIISCLSSSMEKTHYFNIPKLTVLTDATTQKISLKKFVAKECHIDQSEVEICCYSLIHWDDPSARGRTDETYREGHMLCRIQEAPSNHFLGAQLLPSTLIHGNNWKPAYVVLREGILCIFNNKQDSKPQLFLHVGGEDCTGCRRCKNSDREHAIEVNKSDGSSWQLAAASEHEVNDWLQSLCQAAAEATEKTSHRPGCLPCCLILTPQKLLMCHEDVQTNFFRILGSANVTDVTGVSVDSTVESFCVLDFEAHEEGVSSEQWVLYFNAEYEKDRFIKSLSTAWSAQFQVEVHVNTIEDFSLQQNCRELATHLHSALIVK